MPDSLLDFMQPEDRQRVQSRLQQATSTNTPDWFDYMQPEDQARYAPEQVASHRRAIQTRDPIISEDPAEYVTRRMIPFGSSLRSFVETRAYGQAKERIDSGRGTQNDRDIVSWYEARRRHDEERGIGGEILSGLAHVPALVGETLTGGAVIGRVAPGLAAAGGATGYLGRTAAITALAPSMYLPQAAERAAGQGGEWYEPQNLGPAAVMGLFQTAILGSLPNVGRNIAGSGAAAIMSRLGIRTATGMAEQQVVDAIGGVADAVLPEAYQTRTRFGLLGSAIRGEWGEASKHAAVQVATFAAFSALHPILHGEQRPAEQPPPEQPALPGQPRPMSEPTQMPGFMRPRPAEAPAEAPVQSLEFQPSGVIGTRFGRPEVLEAYRTVLDKLASVGYTAEGAAKKVAPVLDRFMEAIQRKPDLTSQEALSILGTLKLRGPLRDFTEVLAETLKPYEAVNQPQIPTIENAPEAVVATPRPQGEVLPTPETPQIAPEATGRLATETPVQAPPVAQAGQPAIPTASSRPELEAARRILPFGRIAELDFPESAPPQMASDLSSAASALRRAVGGKRATEMMQGKEAFPTEAEFLKRYDRSLSFEAMEIRDNIVGQLRRIGVKDWKKFPDITDFANGQAFFDAMLEADAKMRSSGAAFVAGLVRKPALPSAAQPQEPVNLLSAAPVPAVESRGVNAPIPKGAPKELTPKLQAKWEAKLGEAGERNLGSEIDPITGEVVLDRRMSTGRHFGAEPIPEEIKAAIVNASLEPHEQKVLEGIFSGNSLRAMDQIGAITHPESAGKKWAGKPMSYESIRKVRDEAFAKLKEANPGILKDFDSATDFDLQSKTEHGKRLLDELTEQGAIRLQREHADRIREVEAALDEQISLTPQEIEADNATLRRIDRQLGISPEATRGDIETASAADISAYRRERGIPRTQAAAQSAAKTGTQGLGGGRVEPSRDVKKSILEKAKELWTDDQGAINLDAAKELGNKMGRLVKYLGDNMHVLGGGIFPNITRLARKFGEATARFTASDNFVKQAVPDYIDTVLGKNATPEFDVLIGSIVEQQRRDDARTNVSALAKTEKDVNRSLKLRALADGIKDVIGAEGVPFSTRAEFDRLVSRADVQAALNRYDTKVVPDAEQYFRTYKGLDPDAEIESMTQRKSGATKSIAIFPGEETETTGFIGGRGNLKNARVGLMTSALEATLAHDAYELSMSKKIEAMFHDRVSKANKAEMFRVGEETGGGMFGRPGLRFVFPDGEKAIEIPNVRPAKQANLADPGETSFYIKESGYQEMRQALAVDQPTSSPVIQAINSFFTKAVIVSGQEPAYHSKNNLTALFNEGANPFDMIKHTARMLQNNPETKAQLLELTRIGATKSTGLETGFLFGGKYDPTLWMSKFLHFIDNSVRLTMNDAFDRNVRWGRIEDTETNRRDFINKSLGNYNKRSQHKLVVWLRDIGLGPFATAGTTYIMQGMRTLVGQPLVQGTSAAASLGMRAEKIAKVGAVLAVVGLANLKLWGSVFGDDDTPIGAIKTGTTEDGKTTYLDLTSFTGLTRGMRQTGLLALSEGLRQGSSAERIGDRAFTQVSSSILHPGTGPAVAFAHTLLTGKNSIGAQVAQEPPPSGSRTLENARAGLIHANPVIAAALSEERVMKDMTWAQKALTLIGPYNPFRISGDRILAEMHGTLRELEDARQVFLREPNNTGESFPRESEYQILHRLDRQIQRLDGIIQGRVRTRAGTRQMDRAEAVEAAQLRQSISQLARIGLEITRDLRR